MNHPDDPGRRHRRSLRLKEYDYAQAGAYFVTVVVQARLLLFGDVVDGEMRLNQAGATVMRVWEEMPDRFPNIEMDAFVVMPNHIHGIIVVVGAPLVGAQDPRATTRVAPTGGRGLGDVVGAYKSLTTVEYGRGVKAMDWAPFHGRLWQRNYYEHILRNEQSMEITRQYILDNPLQWAFDAENRLAITPSSS